MLSNAIVHGIFDNTSGKIVEPALLKKPFRNSVFFFPLILIFSWRHRVLKCYFSYCLCFWCWFKSEKHFSELTTLDCKRGSTVSVVPWLFPLVHMSTMDIRQSTVRDNYSTYCKNVRDKVLGHTYQKVFQIHIVVKDGWYCIPFHQMNHVLQEPCIMMITCFVSWNHRIPKTWYPSTSNLK